MVSFFRYSVLSILVFETVIWLDWLATEAQEPTCFYLSSLGIMPSFLTWVLQIELGSLCLQGKHFIN